LPHNRRGAEPPPPRAFCQPVRLPSGRVEPVLTGTEVEEAYRTARHPKASADEVTPLPLEETTIRELFARYAQP